MKIEWDGIPEAFWPDTDTPWRVCSGFGAFKDFATQEEAQTFYENLLAKEERAGLGWDALVREPFNAVEIET
jgi:hypothetical protein